MRLACGLVLLGVLASACTNVLSRTYEYEEEIFLELDGSATVYVNAAVPALVVLRGAPLPVDPAARLDRTMVRDFYQSPVARVMNVTTSRRDNRRYVHLRLDVPDIRKLGESPAFQWSAYTLAGRDGLYEYTQRVGQAGQVGQVGQVGRVEQVGWDGSELVAVRLHLPSRVPFHNSPSRTIERGNIIVWEQPLADRMKGVPIDIQVRMETESILIRTLTLFGLMALAVVAPFVAALWWVRTRKA